MFNERLPKATGLEPRLLPLTVLSQNCQAGGMPNNEHPFSWKITNAYQDSLEFDQCYVSYNA